MPEVYASNEVKAELIDPISGSVLLSTEIPYRRDLTISERPVYAQRGYHRSNTLSAAHLRSMGSVSLRKDAESLALAAEIKRWQKGLTFYALSSDLKGKRYRHPHLRITFTNADGSQEVVTAYNVKLSDRSLSAADGGIVGDTLSLDVLGGFEPKEGGYEPVRALDFHRTGPATYLSLDGLKTAGDGEARFGLPYKNAVALDSSKMGLILEGIGVNYFGFTDLSAHSNGATAPAPWAKDSGVSTLTVDTSIKFGGLPTLKAVTAATNAPNVYQFVTRNTSSHSVTLYIRRSDSAALTSADITHLLIGGTAHTDHTIQIVETDGIAATTGWHRVTLTKPGVASSATYGVRFKAGDPRTYYIGHPQLEESPFPTSFIANPTSGTATRQPDAVGIVPPHNLLKWSEDFSQWANNFVTVDSTLYPGPDGLLNARKLTKVAGAFAVRTQDFVVQSAGAKTYAIRLKADTLSKATLRVLNLTTGSDVKAATVVTLTSGWATYYVTTNNAISKGDTLRVYIYPDDSTLSVAGSIFAAKAQAVEGSHPGPYVRTTDTPIPAPVSPALDPAWSQNGRVKVRILPPSASTGKTYFHFGYSALGLQRIAGWAASLNNWIACYRPFDSASNTYFEGGIGINLYDGAPHDIEIEWTNEINEQTGVREMWRRLFVDGVLRIEQNVAALYGATAWTPIDPSRLISDGNCFAVLSRISLDYPTRRPGYRQI